MDGMITLHCAKKKKEKEKEKKKWEMAGSPPSHPGFGTTGKSFLIDNLLRSGRGSPPSSSCAAERLVPKERRLSEQHQRAATEVPTGPWSVRHVALDTQSFAQAKHIGVSQTHTGR